MKPGENVFPGGSFRGVSLLETLIGLAVGLLVVLTAVGFLASTRLISSHSTDEAGLMAQANNAMRLIGSQLRPAGSVELLALNRTAALVDQVFVFSNRFDGLDLDNDRQPDGGYVWGQEGANGASDTLVLSFESRSARMTPDCLGAGTAASLGRVDSRFYLRTGRLLCLGSGNPNFAQPVAESVEDFQVRYAVRSGDGATARQQWTQADRMDGLWRQVRAVEVCLQMVGTLGGPRQEGRQFVGCNGQAQAYDGRRHIVLRNVFVIRGAGRLR